MTHSPRPSSPESSSSALRVALAWLYVGVPLAWGVWLTIVKSLALFS